MVYDEENSRVVIFETKVAKSPDELPKACDAALRQIEARQYADLGVGLAMTLYMLRALAGLLGGSM